MMMVILAQVASLGFYRAALNARRGLVARQVSVRPSVKHTWIVTNGRKIRPDFYTIRSGNGPPFRRSATPKVLSAIPK